jgi:hypothetical protein
MADLKAPCTDKRIGTTQIGSHEQQQCSTLATGADREGFRGVVGRQAAEVRYSRHCRGRRHCGRWWGGRARHRRRGRRRRGATLPSASTWRGPTPPPIHDFHGQRLSGLPAADLEGLGGPRWCPARLRAPRPPWPRRRHELLQCEAAQGSSGHVLPPQAERCDRQGRSTFFF